MPKKVEEKYKYLIRENLEKGHSPHTIFKSMRAYYGKQSPCYAFIRKVFQNLELSKNNNTSSSLVNSNLNTTKPTTSIKSETKDDDDVVYVKTEAVNGMMHFPRISQYDPNLFLNLVALNLKPEKILGDFTENNQRFFLVKWKNSLENTNG